LQTYEQLASSQSGVWSFFSPMWCMSPKQVHSHLLGSFQSGLLESASHDFSLQTYEQLASSQSGV
jgi:hypothetical protein